MHAPSSRAARHGCSTERQRRGTGTGCERLSGRALTQPAVLAMIKRAVRGEAGDVDLPLGNRHSDPDPGEEEAAEAARYSFTGWYEPKMSLETSDFRIAPRLFDRHQVRDGCVHRTGDGRSANVRNKAPAGHFRAHRAAGHEGQGVGTWRVTAVSRGNRARSESGSGGVTRLRGRRREPESLGHDGLACAQHLGDQRRQVEAALAGGCALAAGPWRRARLAVGPRGGRRRVAS